MTIANTPLPAAPAARTDDAAVADVTALLPTREVLLQRLAERAPTADDAPATLLIVGLLRRDDGWPTPAATIAQVTSLLARSLRGDDWLGSSGAAEFAVVLDGPVHAAETAGGRLVAAVTALGVPGLSAAAGIAPLAGDVAAAEVFRRATLSLTAARRVGPGTVIRYREPA
jgi:GGDEF domain-containing protein